MQDTPAARHDRSPVLILCAVELIAPVMARVFEAKGAANHLHLDESWHINHPERTACG